MAIYNIKEGNKRLLAEVNKLENVKKATGAEFLTVSANENKEITIGLTGVKSAIEESHNLAIEIAQDYTNDSITEIGLRHDTAKDDLILERVKEDGTIENLGTVNLAVPRSNVIDFGFYVWDGDKFIDYPDFEGLAVNNPDAEPGTPFLVITYKKDDGTYTRTFTEVDDLLNTNLDTVYHDGDGITVTNYEVGTANRNNIISIKLKDKEENLEKRVGLRLAPEGLSFGTPIITRAEFDAIEAVPEVTDYDGLYFVLDEEDNG